jgi:hypothetical protein
MEVIAMAETEVQDAVSTNEYLELNISDDDSMYSTRSRTSTRRYQPPAQPRVSGTSLTHGTPIQRRSSRGTETEGQTETRAGTGAKSGTETGTRSHPPKKVFAAPSLNSFMHQRRFPVLALAAGMLLMMLLVLGVNAFTTWLHVFQDDLTYGRPRTFQFNAVVGHDDSLSNPTHFMIINLNRHIEIIEFPGGDTTHARIYSGPVLFGNGQNLTPVTATVKDVNGDGKPDLILHIQDQVVVFINTGTTFRPLQPGEHIDLST